METNDNLALSAISGVLQLLGASLIETPKKLETLLLIATDHHCLGLEKHAISSLFDKLEQNDLVSELIAAEMDFKIILGLNAFNEIKSQYIGAADQTITGYPLESVERLWNGSKPSTGAKQKETHVPDWFMVIYYLRRLTLQANSKSKPKTKTVQG